MFEVPGVVERHQRPQALRTVVASPTIRDDKMGAPAMRDTTAEKCFICSCGWISAHRFPLWRRLPRSCQCSQCGGEAESVVVVGADHSSLAAAERARLRWMLNVTTCEASTAG
jgi:hypothetical protein